MTREIMVSNSGVKTTCRGDGFQTGGLNQAVYLAGLASEFFRARALLLCVACLTKGLR